MSPTTTPSPGDEGPEGPDTPDDASDDAADATDDAARREAAEAFARLRRELADTPAVDIVANHVIGLWQLALIHLGLDRPDEEPDLEQARLVVDAVSALVDGLGERLGRHHVPLRDALAQLRLAYAQIAGRADAPDGPNGTP